MTLTSPETVSPLRRRMLDDMAVRNFSPDTQREYVRAVKKLAAFLRRPPDTATAEEVRAFQIHLKEAGTRPPTMNATVTALRFFFKVTVDRPETTRHLLREFCDIFQGWILREPWTNDWRQGGHKGIKLGLDIYLWWPGQVVRLLETPKRFCDGEAREERA